MINILVCGARGKMGKIICELVEAENDMKLVCGVDVNSGYDGNTPIYSSFDDVKEKVDVVIDFSSPKAIDSILNFAKEKNCSLVLASTGYSGEQLEKIKNADLPIFKTANFSLGVNLLCELVKKTASVLGESFDIEIIERHHNKKVDAPSGTALMLADSINSDLENAHEYMFGREGTTGKRGKEIGIHAVRGGTIVGEHEVAFCGEDEIVTLSHSARSKRVFAVGAVKAARFMANKPNGKYDMTNLLKDIL